MDGVITFIESLETFPERGSVRESVIPGLRIIGYRRSVSVAFSVRDGDIFILGVFARGRDIFGRTARRARCLAFCPQGAGPLQPCLTGEVRG